MIYSRRDMMFFRFVYLCKAVLVILFRHHYLHNSLASLAYSLWVCGAVKHAERAPLNVPIYVCHLEISNAGISTSWKTFHYDEIELFKELEKIYIGACWAGTARMLISYWIHLWSISWNHLKSDREWMSLSHTYLQDVLIPSPSEIPPRRVSSRI